jgi:flavin-binding protein dodecin
VIELTAESNESFEGAITQGAAKAAETVRNIRSAWVKEQQVVVVDGGAITAFRVDPKITFVLD